MKEAILEPLLRKMRLSKVLPSLKQFHSPKVLDIGCGWEARLLKEIEPFIALGIGIDFKAPHIKTEKLYTFSYFFEPKDSNSSPQNLDITTQNNILGLLAKLDKNAMGGAESKNDTYDTHINDSKNHKIVSLPFPDESFEVVTMLAVLEHLNYPLEMLLEIRRVLKPNGILLLTAPSHLAKPVLEFLSYKLHIVSEDEIRDHKRYYDKKDLLSLANDANLTLLQHKYFQCGMNNFAKITKRDSTPSD